MLHGACADGEPQRAGGRCRAHPRHRQGGARGGAGDARRRRARRRITLGADKAYDVTAFVGDCARARSRRTSPSTARTSRRGNVRKTHRRPDHASCRLRDQPAHPQADRGGERLDQDGGWNGADQVPRPRARGLDVSIQGRSLQPHPTAWTAGDRMSLSDQRPKAIQATPGHRKIAAFARRSRKPQISLRKPKQNMASSAAC